MNRSMRFSLFFRFNEKEDKREIKQKENGGSYVYRLYFRNERHY